MEKFLQKKNLSEVLLKLKSKDQTQPKHFYFSIPQFSSVFHASGLFEALKFSDFIIVLILVSPRKRGRILRWNIFEISHFVQTLQYFIVDFASRKATIRMLK